KTNRCARPSSFRRTKSPEFRAPAVRRTSSLYHTTFAHATLVRASPSQSVRTSYRDIFLLSCCQALLLVNAAGLITMNGLAGYALADTKALATLGVTTYVLGSAASTLPFSLWMAKVGRRVGFMTGALINIVGCAL